MSEEFPLRSDYYRQHPSSMDAMRNADVWLASVPLGILPPPEELWEVVEERNSPCGVTENCYRIMVLGERLGPQPIIAALKCPHSFGELIVALATSLRCCASDEERMAVIPFVFPYLASRQQYAFAFSQYPLVHGTWNKLFVWQIALNNLDHLLLDLEQLDDRVFYYFEGFSQMVKSASPFCVAVRSYFSRFNGIFRYGDGLGVLRRIFELLQDVINDNDLSFSQRKLAYDAMYLMDRGTGIREASFATVAAVRAQLIADLYPVYADPILDC